MKRFALILCGLAVLTLACPTMAAKDDKKPAADKAAKKKEAKGGKKTGLRGYYSILASVVKLTDEQKAKLTKKLEDRAAALKAWDDGDKGKKVAELTAKAKDADKDAAKEIRKEIAALRKERAELSGSPKATQALLDDILTDEQKTIWAGHQLYTQMMRQFKKVAPTEAQEGKIRVACNAKAADAQAAADDAKALKKLRTDLAETIRTDILTEEQRTKLTAKKEKPEPKPKKEKKEK